MAKEGRPPPGNRDQSTARTRASQAAQPFDHWLHKQLHEMYDAIANEPLPDDILRLIDDDDAAAGGKPVPGDDKGREKN